MQEKFWLHKCMVMAAAVVGVIFFPIAVYAADVPDTTRTGSVTLNLEYEGQSVEGGEFSLYKIASIVSDDDVMSYAAEEEFALFDGELDEIDSDQLADEIYDYIIAQGIASVDSSENNAGVAVFDNLDLGLYLVVQTEASTGYEKIRPFLVSVPLQEDEGYVYNVNAYEKFTITKAPTPDEKTPDKKLPQTGQVNWPIPILTIAGVVLFMIGWMFRFGQDKKQYAS